MLNGAEEVSYNEICNDACIKAGGKFELITDEYEGGSVTNAECVIDREICGSSWKEQSSIDGNGEIVDFSRCDVGCMLSG